MQAPVFDGITRELGERSSRRSFMRLLGGAAAMGAVTLVGSDAEAKRRGKNQGQVTAQGKKGQSATITICYQKQTLTVKKKGYQATYPGATVGPCPVVVDPQQQGGGGSTQGGSQQGGTQQGGPQQQLPDASQNCRATGNQCGTKAGVQGECRLAVPADNQAGFLCTSNTAGNACMASTQCGAGTRCVIEGNATTCRVVIA